MLTDVTFKRIYRTRTDNLVRDFFEPALKLSRYYDRAAGYFSIRSLLELSPGLVPFVKKGGVIRLVTSVELSKESEAIIKEGHRLQEINVVEDLKKALEKKLEDAQELVDMDLIVNLIACDRLQIRVAYMPDGIYHEKFGIFEDEESNVLYFSGSSNATKGGHERNKESFTVLSSWRDGTEDIDSEVAYFESLWNNNEDGLEVMCLPAACKEGLIRTYKVSESVEDAISNVESTCDGNTDGVKRLYEYQEDAVNEFLVNNGRHFFQMATGTGKTFTAIKAIQSAERNYGSLLCFIVVPQIDLQDQWREELLEQGIECRLCGGLSNRDARTTLDEAVIEYYNEGKTEVIVAVYPTFFEKLAKEFDSLADAEKMIVVDEAHSLSKNQIRLLPESQRRLGLSATPERFSQIETEQIIAYFTGGTISPYVYDIDKAISSGTLSHYYYHPMTVELDEDAFGKFAFWTKKIAVLMNQDPVDEQKLNDARTARSLILKKATSKLELLVDLVTNSSYEFSNSVVYCGAGKDPDSDEPIIDRVLQIIGGIGQYTVSSFTSKSVDRVKIINEFEKGFFDTLVAIKCFDQGIDVPKLDKIYIMASDSSRRQTVQRRGRVLRKCATTGKTHANIYDMVVLPPSDYEDASSGRSLVSIELARVEEYGSVADNREEIQYFVQSLKDTYDIQEAEFDEDAI